MRFLPGLILQSNRELTFRVELTSRITMIPMIRRYAEESRCGTCLGFMPRCKHSGAGKGRLYKFLASRSNSLVTTAGRPAILPGSRQVQSSHFPIPLIGKDFYTVTSQPVRGWSAWLDFREDCRGFGVRFFPGNLRQIRDNC
jgi:hypothetical protein